MTTADLLTALDDARPNHTLTSVPAQLVDLSVKLNRLIAVVTAVIAKLPEEAS